MATGRGFVSSVKPSSKSYVDITKAPKCLISFGERDEIIINEDVLKALSQRDNPAVVIGIAGKCRTGKSYLMNQLAGERGFTLGSTVESHTKGIWIWVLDHPCDPDLDLILLDTEGLLDIENRNADLDNKIFCLTLLLSSTLVFNVTGVLDQSNVEMLGLILKLSKMIKTKKDSKQTDADFDEYCPDLIVAHRDFTAQLVVKGEKVSANQYLEHCLKVKDCDNKFDQAILGIRKYFKRRACFIFRQPSSWEVLDKLEDISKEALDKDFVKETKRFIDFVYLKCGPKTLRNEVQCNGAALAQMLKIYVKSIQREDLLCIEGVMDQIAETQDDGAIDRAVDIFQENVERRTLPVGVKKLAEYVSAARKLAINYFEKNVIRSQDQRLIEIFMNKIENLEQELFQKNINISQEKCKTFLKKASEEIEVKINSDFYFKIGGCEELQKDIDTLRLKYRAQKGLGAMRRPVFDEYHDSKILFLQEIQKVEKDLLQCQNATQRLARKKNELEMQTNFAELEKEKARKDLDTQQQLLDLDLAEKLSFYMAEIRKMEQRMEALEAEKNSEIASLSKKILEKQNNENVEKLISDWDDFMKEQTLNEDKRQEELEKNRIAEIDRGIQEGIRKHAARLQEEYEHLKQEYIEKRKMPQSTWVNIRKKLAKKIKPVLTD